MLIVWYCRVAQSVLLDNSKLFHKSSIFAHTFSMYHGQGSFVCVCFYLEGGGWFAKYFQEIYLAPNYSQKLAFSVLHASKWLAYDRMGYAVE